MCLTAGAVVLASLNELQACAVCFGGEGSSDTQAAGWAILAMLAMLTPMMATLLGLIVYLGMKSRKCHADDAALWGEKMRAATTTSTHSSTIEATVLP